MDTVDVLVVGSGHAGAQVAIALRKEGFEGSIALVSEEMELPYERPPLSKDYLAGDKSFDRLLIRQPAFWHDQRISLLPGRRISTVHPSEHRVEDEDGRSLSYRWLIWAAGGKPRRLRCPGHDLQGIHVVRTRADIDAIRSELPSVSEVVVIGGGYIGLETAAVLRKLGKEVVLLEAQDRVLARVAGPMLSRFYQNEHRAHGVDVRTSVQLESIVGDRGRATGVRLASGELIAAQMVIVGIGIVPSVAPLIASGARGDNGVLVDAQCRTSLPDVFAIGDCAQHVNRYAAGAAVRLESVQNANDQASVVAKTIVGKQAFYDVVPWFWSDQYDLKLQTIGLSAGHDTEVLRGDPGTRSFSIVYLRNGRVIALDCINSPADFVQGRKLVADHVAVDPAKLADTSTPLKSLCPQLAGTISG